ncbi:MAG TPA: LCP family protein [Gaiellaceae bacterium]|nr:LCP family protein [Gaiellaceae bacterium]
MKRGIGRAGSLNGNGHAALPPLFGPIVRYRQPEPPRKSLLALILRGFGWLLLAVAVVGAGAAGGVYLYGHEALSAVSARSKDLKDVEHSKQLTAIPSPSQPAIALVAGYDVRGAPKGPNPYARSNSDTLMLMRADPKNDTLSLLSFPRDLYVGIYCHGDTLYTHGRINSAWSVCSNGPEATLDTMEKLTGLKINYLITLDFHAFTQIVDHLHGIYMNVDRRYFIAPNTGTSAINLHPGYQKLDGAEALSYVRYRHTDSDIYRTGRQQLFLDALKSRVKSGLSIFDVLKLIGDLKHNVEIAKGGSGHVTPEELKSYLGLLYGLPAGHLFRNAVPLNDFQNIVVGGADMLQSSPGAIAAAVHSFRYPDVRDAGVVNAQFGGHKKTVQKTKKQPKLPKSKISVLVLNAGQTAGEAVNTTYLLSTKGYATKSLPAGEAANAPKVQRDTTVYYDPVGQNAQQAAQQLRPLFGPHTRVAQMTTTIAGFAKQAGNPLTVVAVGTSFGGKLVVHTRPKVQPKQPPQVSEGAASTAPALRSVYDEVHFPLMVPHKIAQGSALSSDEGVRGFKPLKNQHEVALTFNIAGGEEYWQIEETTWNSAPILQNPTGTIPYRGGKLLLYSTGGALQRVALRKGNATYWVENTILNQLSNSTMIAIAKSFRPLHR